MTYPTVEDKHENESVVTAADYVHHEQEAGALPTDVELSTAFFVYQPALYESIVESYPGEEIDLDNVDTYLLDPDRRACVAKMPIGAPMTAAHMEVLREYGVELFVQLEFCGCLQPDFDARQAIVIDRAVRDEGTSYHYQPPSKYATAPEEGLATAIEALDAAGVEFSVGATWATDAFFRETEAEIRQFRQEGVLAADMQASTVFAVADYYDLDAMAIFAPADYLGAEWDLSDFDVNRILEDVFDALVTELDR